MPATSEKSAECLVPLFHVGMGVDINMVEFVVIGMGVDKDDVGVVALQHLYDLGVIFETPVDAFSKVPHCS